jgi:shikimate dehydrogenase
MDWVYLPFEVRPDELFSAITGIKALGFVGINCTIPHKEAVMEFLDEISPEAQAIGAVNTIHIVDGKLKGYNTDGGGFMRSVREIDSSGVSDKKVFIMGAGGAGRAVGVQSAIDGAATISLCDKDEERAELLTEHIRSRVNFKSAEFIPSERSKIAASLRDADIFVDATPLGMKEDDPLSIEVKWLQPETLVVDLVYNPPKTLLLKGAEERGCRTLNGIGMLLHQGAKSFEIWAGVNAPLDVMHSALEKAVYGREKN